MKPSEKLMQKIMEEPSRPVPRWVILLKNKLVLAVFVLAILIGGISFSIILLAIQQTDFNLLSHMSHSPFEMILGLLPFIWIAMLILFLIVSMYSILYSQRGYKFSLARLFLNSAVLSILIGTLFFIAGGAQKLEQAFAVNVSVYESIQERKQMLWSNPEDGLLSGRIIGIDSETLRLKDFKDRTWEVEFSEAFIAGRVLMEPGEIIKLVGNVQGKNTFVAQEIRPWGGHGQMFQNQ